MDKKYYLQDPESGYSYEVTKEQHESFMKLWNYFRPKIHNKNIGVPIITGTAGEMNVPDYEKIFYQIKSKYV